MSQLSAIGRKRQKVVSELKNNFFTVFLPTRCLLARHNAQHQRPTFSKVITRYPGLEIGAKNSVLFTLSISRLSPVWFLFFIFFFSEKGHDLICWRCHNMLALASAPYQHECFGLAAVTSGLNLLATVTPSPSPLNLKKKKKDNHKLLSIFN